MSKRRVKWTEETLKIEASKYDNKSEFKRAVPSAYSAMRIRYNHLLDELFANQINYWTEDKIREEALRYDSKSELRKKNNSAYITIHKYFNHLLDEIFGASKITRWTEDKIREEALKYPNKQELKKGNPKAYDTMYKRYRNLADELFSNERKPWTEKAIRAEASRYQTKIEMIRGNKSAYNAMRVRYKHLMNDICSHMEDGFAAGDNDSIYIWEAVGEYYNDKKLYKIGVTSARLGEKRIYQVAKKKGWSANIVTLMNTKCKATDIEKDLLLIGDNPMLKGFDGSTELRAMNNFELNVALKLIRRKAK